MLLNTILFFQLCQEFGSDEQVLFLHAEVHWLSRGNVAVRVELLKEQLNEFFKRDHKTKSLEFTKKL